MFIDAAGQSTPVSVHEVVRHLIYDQGFTAFSVESVRAIMQNKMATMITYPGEYNNSGENQTLQHDPAEASSSYGFLKGGKSNTVTSPIEPQAQSESSTEPASSSSEPTDNERGLIAIRISGLINLNLIREDPEEWMAPSVIMNYMKGRPYTLREITAFLDKSGFQYPPEAVKIILEEPRTAIFAPTKASSSNQLTAPKEMDTCVRKVFITIKKKARTERASSTQSIGVKSTFVDESLSTTQSEDPGEMEHEDSDKTLDLDRIYTYSK